jgi:hypothetical protein
MAKVSASRVGARGQTFTDGQRSGSTPLMRAAHIAVIGWGADLLRRCHGRPATSQSNGAALSASQIASTRITG